MKIAAFIFNLSRGGAQGVFVNLVNYLSTCGMDIEVVTYNMKDAIYADEIKKEIKITNLDVYSSRKALPKIKEYISKNEFDCAIAFSSEVSVNLVISRKLCKKKFRIIGRCINTLSYEYKYVTTFFRKYITHTMVKMFYHKVDVAIAQSRGMGQDLIDNYGFKNDQIKVINNPMNPSFEQEANSSNIDKKENNIIFVGRLEQQKGLKMLLQVFSGIEDKTVKLLLIGSGSMKEELQQMSEELNIADRVVFVEHTKQIMEYYKKTRATILSSYFEGFPNVLVESIACGTPVVAYDLPSGPSEIILEGENGYLAEYLNEEDLKKKINIALSREWDYGKIKETSKRFARDIIMSKYFELLKEQDS